MKLTRIHHAETPSTLDLAREGADHLSSDEVRVYTTDSQTQGRGTHARKWAGPKNLGIYPTYSFLAPVNCFEQLHFFPLIAGYAVSLMLQDYGLLATIKWPNDVLLGLKKTTGILCESYSARNHRVINIGIGVNVNMPPAWCNSIEQPVTSMAIEAGKNFVLEAVQVSLTTHILTCLEVFSASGFHSFFQKISDRLERFEGKDILFDTQNNELFLGKIVGINTNGHLCLNGEENRSFFSGRILRESS
jgi:BirA family biotin operon repressor/biotin-[acetyl-CoA-carboxylase] ligase